MISIIFGWWIKEFFLAVNSCWRKLLTFVIVGLLNCVKWNFTRTSTRARYYRLHKTLSNLKWNLPFIPVLFHYLQVDVIGIHLCHDSSSGWASAISVSVLYVPLMSLLHASSGKQVQGSSTAICDCRNILHTNKPIEV